MIPISEHNVSRVPSPRSPRAYRAMSAFLCQLPVLLLAVWFAGLSVLQNKAVRVFENNTTPAPPDLSAPAPWRASRLFVDPDAYAWLSYARDLRASPHFRVRFTRMDNAPFGRSVHWAQLPIWSLCGIAFLLERFGLDSAHALELSGRILMPLVGFLFFSALWFVLRRRIPPLLAALVVLASAAALFWDFHPLRPDHHGFHLAAAFLFVLPLLFSSFGFASSSRRNALPFILSGFFGGVALWLGATVFYFTLAAAALAAALAILSKNSSDSPVSRHPPLDASAFDPAVWRLWGFSGFAASLFFWLLEYAPAHFSMRLEANHPLYALSFLGIGECLCLLSRFRHDARPRLSPAFLLHSVLALAAAATLPALVLFGPTAFYIPRSPFMLRLHALHIQEFLPLFAVAGKNPHHLLAFFALPVAIAAVASFLAGASMASCPLARRRFFFVLPFCLLFVSLYLWQFRWERMAILSAMLPVVAFGLSRSGARPRMRFLLHALLALQCAVAVRDQVVPWTGYLRGGTIDPDCLRAFQYRACAVNFAQALSAPGVEPTRNGDSPAVLAPVELAPYLYYFAHIPSVSSLYWENLAGNEAAAAAFADTSPVFLHARDTVWHRGISHVFMLEGAQDALLFFDLATGNSSMEAASGSLGGILAGARPHAPLPSWLGVDPALNALSNPTLYQYVPSLGKYAPFRFPCRIYSVRTD